MPAPLTEPNTKVCWRVFDRDLDTLQLLFPGRVNEVVRELLGVYCERLRSGLKTQQNQGVNEGP